jgi:myb proto-oncogene protein
LDPNIDRASGRRGRWTVVEDNKLKDALKTHGDKDWGAISAVVPDRTGKQCWSRWHDVLDPVIGRACGRKGRWTEDEDSNLKDVVQTLGDKDWGAISVLVPGRTANHCRRRWKEVLDPSIDEESGRKVGRTEAKIGS